MTRLLPFEEGSGLKRAQGVCGENGREGGDEEVDEKDGGEDGGVWGGWRFRS